MDGIRNCISALSLLAAAAAVLEHLPGKKTGNGIRLLTGLGVMSLILSCISELMGK